jgi:putative FmdB family regulatory protein
MPTYDYRCQKCGHCLEVLQKITDEPLTKCDACGSNDLRRGFGGGIGVSFQGTGFYATDYCKKSEGGCCPCDKNK